MKELEHILGIFIQLGVMMAIVHFVTSSIVQASEKRIRKEIAELRKQKEEE